MKLQTWRRLHSSTSWGRIIPICRNRFIWELLKKPADSDLASWHNQDLEAEKLWLKMEIMLQILKQQLLKVLGPSAITVGTVMSLALAVDNGW